MGGMSSGVKTTATATTTVKKETYLTSDCLSIPPTTKTQECQKSELQHFQKFTKI